MSYLPDIVEEEHNYLLKSLLNLTKKDPAVWECTDFSPLGFLLAEDKDGKEIACITQNYSLQAEINCVGYDLSISESIDFETEKGDVFLNLEKHSPEISDEIIIGLSLEPEYDDLSAEQLFDHFHDHIAVQLSDIFFPYALKSDMASSVLQWASYNILTGIPVKFKRNKFFKFGQKMFDSQRFLDFHRCVLDLEFRKKLMAELD